MERFFHLDWEGDNFVWNDLKLKQIVSIEKLISEYRIWEFEKSPYGVFKIKVYLNEEGLFSGYSNIQVIDEIEDYYCAVGYRKSEDEALKDTIMHFFNMTSRKKHWDEDDFKFMEL